MAFHTSGHGRRNDLVSACYSGHDSASSNGGDVNKRTLQPYVTGSSVLGLKYKDGVMISCDTLGSYGSSARYHHIPRIEEIGECSLIAASGELSDFQWISVLSKELELEDWASEDGHRLDAKELSSFLCRVMYNRRSKFNPLWNSIIVAGCRDGNKHLSYIDSHGTSFEENCIATGFGAYFALPLLREKWRSDMSETEAREMLTECMRILFYRDCQAHNNIQIAKATNEGLSVETPITLKTSWGINGFTKPTSSLDMVGCAW